jgi:NADH pyrophosphatase NudC (nudix superfamily)
MSASDFHFSLMDNVDSLHATLNKRKAFYIIVQNLTDKVIPQVKVKLSCPPGVKLLVKEQLYGGIAERISKKRVFKVLPKENGLFNLTATLTTRGGHNIELPISFQVGDVQEIIKPISLVPKLEAENTGSKINCPYCSDKIDEDSKYCPHCGSDLVYIKEESGGTQEEIKTEHCLSCGTELSKEAKFCGKCGQKLV